MPRMLILLLCVIVLILGCKKKSTSGGDDKPTDTPESRTSAPDPNKPILPVRPALPSGWVEFKQPDGAFTIFLPGQPQPMRASAGSSLSQPVPTGRVLMAEYKLQLTGLYIQLGASVYSPELADGVRTASERKALKPGAKRSQVTWAGRPAFEVVTEDPETHRVTVERRLWVGNRSYYCQLWGQQPGQPTTEEQKAIFDSFTLGN